MAKENQDIEEMKGSLTKNKKKRMEDILSEMQVKIGEIEDLRKDLQKEKNSSVSPSKSKSMLEEIKVPSIEMIREDKKKHRWF